MNRDMAGDIERSLEALGAALDEAADLAARSRYEELAAKARDLERQAAELERLRKQLTRSAPATDNARAACRRLRSQTFRLAQVLGHIRLVHAALGSVDPSGGRLYMRHGEVVGGVGGRIEAEA